MIEGGQKYQEARERLGISLNDVEQATKISKRYLAAIENNDDSQLPDYVYAVGFMRSYAKFLDIDSDDIVASYKQSHDVKTDNVPVLPIVDDGGRAIKKANRNPLKKWQVVIIVLLVLAAIAVGVLYTLGIFSAKANDDNPIDNDPALTIPVEGEEELPPQLPTPPVVVDEEEAAPTEQQAQTPPQSAVPGGLEIKIIAPTEKCWLGISKSDGSYKEFTLQKGTETTITDSKYVKIRFGNAPAVQVIVNGVTQDPYVASQYVLTKEFFAAD